MFGKISDTSEIKSVYHFLYGDWNLVIEAMCYPLLLLNLPLWIDFCALAASCEFVFHCQVCLPHEY